MRSHVTSMAGDPKPREGDDRPWQGWDGHDPDDEPDDDADDD